MKVFITGVSSGIGREAVKILIASGHEVWGVARRRDLLEELAKQMNSAKFFYSQCDVANGQDVRETVRLTQKKSFLPDVVVLNSAIFPKDLTDGFDFQKARATFTVNYLGALVWVDHFLPQFLKRGSGKFIAVSSTSAFRPDPVSVSLPASKAALSMAFRSLQLRHNGSGVKFAIVYFGPVATDIVPEFRDTKGLGKLFVMNPQTAGKKLVKAIYGRKQQYYFPFWLTAIFRLTLVFPDWFFSALSKKVKK